MEQIEYDITEFCIKQRRGIDEHIKKIETEACSNPILKTYIRDAKLEEIRQYVAKEIGKPYLDVATVIDMRFIDWLKL
jgi:predicted nucleotidyltransferase